jgi:4-amino-4-deoxy-L-arabinose transferase-like glycosyltransferase
MNKLKIPVIYSLIFLFGSVFYVLFNGQVHLFDWDEINFAESAREMIVSGNYLDVQINFQPFWEKPPLFIWMQVLSMKLFGINEFAARFPNAICGIISLLVLFNFGRKFRDEKFAWLWLLSFTGSILPFFFFKSGIIDPWFNLFIFLSFIYFIFYLSEEPVKRKNLIFSAFFLGLAILTKGPVALLIFILAFITFLLIKKFRIKTSIKDVLLFSIILLITGGFWFILQILNGNYKVIQDFILYQVRLFSTKDAGHGGFFLYHFAVLLFGVFPASIFAISGFKGKEMDKNGNSDFRLWMMILFWTVLILFTIVKTKIVHYSSLCYFPVSFFSAIYLYRYIYQNGKMNLIQKISVLSISTLLGFLISIFPIIEKNKAFILNRGWIKDPFTEGNFMAEVKWTGFEPLIGLIFIVSIWYFTWRTNKINRESITGILISTLLFTFLVVVIITPRIEGYSQRAAIEFYQSVAEKDAYISTLGFKSYAHLYYGKAKPQNLPPGKKSDWLLTGKNDKPVYIVFKRNRKERYLKQYPQLQVLYEKNGFIFTKRIQ